MKRRILLIDDLCTLNAEGKLYFDGIKNQLNDNLYLETHFFPVGCNYKTEIDKAIKLADNFDAVLLDIYFDQEALGVEYVLPKLANMGKPVVIYSYKFEDSDMFKESAASIQKKGRVCLITTEEIKSLHIYLDSLLNTPENFAYINHGFNYRTEDDINLRDKVQHAFNECVAIVDSKKIEVPLVAPVKNFLGDGKSPRPLNSKDSNKLFATISNDGTPLSVRYEGTTLVAKWVADQLREGKGQSFNYHYFQEMVRVEFAEHLDENHYRSFYQAGLELFSLNYKQHLTNINNTINLINKFTKQLDTDLNVVIRLSHLNIINKAFEKFLPNQKDRFAQNKLKDIMENTDPESLNGLQTLLKSIVPDNKLSDLLLDLKNIQLKKISITEGISFVRNSGFYEDTDIQELIDIEEKSSTWNNCIFDPGIKRSLNFYSGVTIQGDFIQSNGALQNEAFGGGGFTGMVESFGFSKPVYSFGLAFGVERLMNILSKKNKLYEHNI